MAGAALCRFVPRQKPERRLGAKNAGLCKGRGMKAQKKRRKKRGAFLAGKALGLFHEAGLDGLGANPHALDLAVFEADAYALDVRLENAVILLYKLQADAAAFLALALVDDYAALDRTLACY